MSTETSRDGGGLTVSARARLQRRTVVVLMLAQVVGSVGMGAMLAVGALIALDLSGSDAWSGMATTMITLGAAAFALPRATAPKPAAVSRRFTPAATKNRGTIHQGKHPVPLRTTTPPACAGKRSNNKRASASANVPTPLYRSRTWSVRAGAAYSRTTLASFDSPTMRAPGDGR